jgi:hypothetical protein
MQRWKSVFQVVLEHHIKQAIEETQDKLDADCQFPWLGDRVHIAMTDAAIAVMAGIEDAQIYLRNEGMLDE